jgi:hypothetical protein
MPTGLDAGGGFVDSPPDIPGLGDVQYEDAGVDWGRSMVGGGYADVGMLTDPSQTGFERIATGIDLGEPVPGPAGRKVSDWRAAFNWQHNPTFWIILFSLFAIGFIHARLSVGGQVGPARAGGGVAV